MYPPLRAVGQRLAACAGPARTPWVWLGVGLLSGAAIFGMVTSTEGLAEQDGPVLGWLRSHRHPSVTVLMEFVSSSTVTVLVPAAVLMATLTIALVRGTWRPVATVLLAFGGASATSLALKGLTQRARPSAAVMLGAPASGWSFPSGHTLLTSALMGALVMLLWRRTSRLIVRAVAATGAVAGALLMGVSRLYLGDHWLTDVLASYALAVSSLAVTAVLLNARNWSGGRAAERRRGDRRGRGAPVDAAEDTRRRAGTAVDSSFGR
jgi:membrane-associated phospholipid phosphatase